MRTSLKQRLVNAAKNRSRDGFEEQFVLEDNMDREYFRFEDSRVAEYDRTKAYGKQLKLSHDEKEGLEEFDFRGNLPLFGEIDVSEAKPEGVPRRIPTA